MKKFDDRKIYLAFAIATFVLAFFIGAISYYSILIVEPAVDEKLSSIENIQVSYREAYTMLQKPQLFAGYEHRGEKSQNLHNILRSFERKMQSNEEFVSMDMENLETLLERRIRGSRLGRFTMFFFLVLSALGMGMFFYERTQVNKQV